jgi:hypothetical protein
MPQSGLRARPGLPLGLPLSLPLVPVRMEAAQPVLITQTVWASTRGGSLEKVRG